MINNMQPQFMYGQAQGYQSADWQRMPQHQNPYMRGFPQQIPSGLPGKFIQSLNDVVVSEVPQDGSVAFFPTSDFQKIYAKAWTADGKIQTEEYVLQKASAEKSPDMQADILARLGRIEEMLSSGSRRTGRKKEGDEDA